MKNLILFFLLALPCWSVQIFVRGLDNKTFTVDIELDKTTWDLKNKIEEKMTLPVYAQRLVYAGKQLADDRPLMHYAIIKESTVHLLLQLRDDEKLSIRMGQNQLNN